MSNVVKLTTEYDSIRTRLDEKIPRDVVSKRDAGQGRKLDYLEGWYVIARMNEIFGQGNWAYKTLDMRNTFAGEAGDKQYVSYVAHVEVTAMGTTFSDYGFGDGSDKYNIGKAHELAVKEAVTDGIKRCCKNFGFSMGLALYDKSQEHVEEGSEIKPKSGAGNSSRTNAHKSGSIPGTDGVNTNTPAPVSSQPAGEVKANSREEENTLIISTARALISLKAGTVEAFKAYVTETYKIADQEKLKPMVEALTDAQATEFRKYLTTKLETRNK